MQRTTAGLWLALALGVFATGCSNDSTAPVAASLKSGQTGAPAEVSEQEDDGDGFTLAVIGDTPYGDAKLAEFPSLVALINADPAVEMVLHAGDIKAGKNSLCTDDYFKAIRKLFDTFADPLVYTPGDNEWTDCHVAVKNNGLYTPTERLLAVRARFFPVAGQTLGINSTHVLSQATDPANHEYVENVFWQRAHVVFATINLPGSNDDLAPWGTPLPADAGNYPSQAAEVVARDRANAAWLDFTFARAQRNHAAGVVLLFQADMWDPAEPLTGYDAIVRHIGTLAAQFGGPVLLLEGDSHAFNVAHPYTAASPFFGMHPSTPAAPNVTRIVVEGSDKGRTEYLRLHINPAKPLVSPFSWERVPLH